MPTFREELTGSPLLYPTAIDTAADAVQFIKLPREGYEQAGVLDSRLIVPGTPTAWGRWAPVAEAASGLAERCHYTFHISHVGSTLLARLLGGHPGVFCLREPVVLRGLSDIHLGLGSPASPWSAEEFERRLSVFLGLWSRTWTPQQTALIKATSYTNVLARRLLERQPAVRAILMYVGPRVLLEALMGGALMDIESSAANRLSRLHQLLGGRGVGS